MEKFIPKKKEYMICFELNGASKCETHQAVCVMSLVANLTPCVLSADNFQLIDMESKRIWNSGQLHRYVIQQSLASECMYDPARYN